MQITSSHKTHDGTVSFVQHDSAATQCAMTFSIFVPKGKGPFPVLYWLSGLTCRATNFTEKAGAYKRASELGLIIVAPDTSPRGTDAHGQTIADDPAYDMGQGAGFYLNATQDPWKPHFQMESYVTKDLIDLVEAHFPVINKRGISGHSMGGHGALTLGMNHPELYSSISAFAPIASPLHCEWGQKAFMAYLGDDQCQWERHDACALMAKGMAARFDDILIDQGLKDDFLEKQLMPQRLAEAAQAASQKITLRQHEGYDHSYYFIQSFIDDHLDFHALRLKAV